MSVTEFATPSPRGDGHSWKQECACGDRIAPRGGAGSMSALQVVLTCILLEDETVKHGGRQKVYVDDATCMLLLPSSRLANFGISGLREKHRLGDPPLEAFHTAPTVELSSCSPSLVSGLRHHGCKENIGSAAQHQ